MAEEDEEEVVVDDIQWLNSSSKPKIKSIDLTKVMDQNWKQQVSAKSVFQSEIWNSSLLKGKGQISEFVKQAISTFDEDELTINRNNMNKKKIKGRYGW